LRLGGFFDGFEASAPPLDAVDQMVSSVGIAFIHVSSDGGVGIVGLTGAFICRCMLGGTPLLWNFFPNHVNFLFFRVNWCGTRLDSIGSQLFQLLLIINHEDYLALLWHFLLQ